MRKWTIIGIVLLALIACGLFYASFNGGISVEAARAQRAEIREYIDEEAKTRLSDTYLITMPYNGRVAPIELVEGTPVKQGQVVSRVVPLDLDLNVAAATAAIERTKASLLESRDTSVESTGLEQSLKYVESMERFVEAAAAQVKASEAKLQYNEENVARIRRLAETNSRTKDELQLAELQYTQARVEYQQNRLIESGLESVQVASSLLPTQVRQYISRKGLSADVLEKQLDEVKVALAQAEKERDRGQMISPVDGVVLERRMSNEGYVAAGTVLLRIGRLDELEVEADVLSQEVVRVKPQNPVDFLGPAMGNSPVKGHVDRVYPAGFTKVSSLGVEQQRVKVVMAFEPGQLDELRRERELGPDYRVRVRIYTASKSSAFVVPRSALFRGPKGDWQLFAIRGERARLQAVTVGLANDESAEITSGLAEGELVIMTPETNLVDGQRVRATSKD